MPLSIPRPLLIVVAIVLVLGVASCGLGLLRGREADPEPTQLGLSLPRVGAEAITATGFGGGSCNRSGTTISVSGGLTGGCQLSIRPQPLRPRELVLQVSGGDATVVVEQRVQGREASSEPESVEAGDPIELTVAGTDELRIRIRCTCTLTVVGAPAAAAWAAGSRAGSRRSPRSGG